MVRNLHFYFFKDSASRLAGRILQPVIKSLLFSWVFCTRIQMPRLEAKLVFRHSPQQAVVVVETQSLVSSYEYFLFYSICYFYRLVFKSFFHLLEKVDF